ncbi:hypothetical protein OSB04_013160 [Centaurea solstitialis]|uniref:Protein kinase domain-containing protein n=1 Tax=Centaurea solstitialis TaxID=347529 RepID=A0AA38WR41_9ASTR|nr:hypothetical protein OSB04_013160 [Centaurea solstitialis]
MSEMKELIHLKIPLQAVKDCTQDFNETNYIGKGGYGKVYKGILNWKDYQNLRVAVKQLDLTGFQGSKEFYTEILMLSQYRHMNIVTLIGFCDDGKEMILVYEYASNGSLDTYLSDPSKLGQLSWETRLHICVGAASALDHLHNHVSTNHRVVHRDIKSANILLDENWNAKLSDFGLSKICLANQQNTFVVTNLAGTHGYCDPQYEKTGILTKESDVYSLGVVLFEVLCGRLACVLNYHDERRFLHHLARTSYKNGEVDKIIDLRIREHVMPESLNMFSAIAYQCLHKTREQRPKTVEVALTLVNVSIIQVSMKYCFDHFHQNMDIFFEYEKCTFFNSSLYQDFQPFSASTASGITNNTTSTTTTTTTTCTTVSANAYINQGLVYKRGSFGRSVDVSRYSGYSDLKQDLGRIFGIEGELEDEGRFGWKLMEFVSCVQSIKILSSTEVQQMRLDGDFGEADISLDGGNV